MSPDRADDDWAEDWTVDPDAEPECCPRHVPDGFCCDADTCEACCNACPTCPSLHSDRSAGSLRRRDTKHSAERR